MSVATRTLINRPISWIWILPALLLCCAYGLLGLTFMQHPNHAEIMQRCVLVDPKLSRIWSVGHIEIGLAYFGVFTGMAIYVIRAGRYDRSHLTDLCLGFAYLIGSFILDYVCVQFFSPFEALLIGDAIVMTFTLFVSQQLWFQRLLGVFVPLVFITCGGGHFMEGLSYWKLTYNVNVPWTMVTADIGFAILVNAARFPAFIRGQDIVSELAATRAEAAAAQNLYRDVLFSVSEGRLHLCLNMTDLPAEMPHIAGPIDLSLDTLSVSRRNAAQAARDLGFNDDRVDCLQTAVGEAAMNAIQHGRRGVLTVCGDQDTMQIWVTDKGTGIQMSQLPRATLERGYSTKQTLGHGFWLMIRAADHTHLLTGPHGTSVVITIAKTGVGLSGLLVGYD